MTSLQVETQISLPPQGDWYLRSSSPKLGVTNSPHAPGGMNLSADGERRPLRETLEASYVSLHPPGPCHHHLHQQAPCTGTLCSGLSRHAIYTPVLSAVAILPSLFFTLSLFCRAICISAVGMG